MTTRPSRLWVGIDASKAHHWWVAIDDTGTTVWSRKVGNDETVILAALSEVRDLADEVCWAVDLTGTAPALLLALLASHGQHVVYVPGRTVNRMSGTYRGEAKTDARDAYVIADTARLRQGFAPVEVPTDLAADLALLTTHRTDLIADRVRLFNRLHDVLTGISPALEAAFDYADHKGALVLLTGYPTPAALRRCGRTRLTRWLTARGVRHPETLALAALTAAHAQHIRLPGQDTAAAITADLATQVLALDDRLKQLDRQIGDAFRAHPQAAVIESMRGIGPILGAEFLVAAGDLAAYPDAGHLASAAGLVPIAKDSGRRTGNLHRPQRYSRRLRRVFYLSAQTSIIRDGPNRTYYLKKRAEGHKHIPAVIALARRRVDVLWALLRDNRPFTATPPARTHTAAAA
ncbi:IS110 family transposase [Streptomyces sp. NRRL F-5065]|uniref:IS110 family transposase n=1 Tax=Streptomyces sp. NRRL F-5065 TaxID=1463855 RepID=UPI0004BEBE97|nr:IS110 family transposase [Streptomyces sp. NRRL F-5065]